MASPLALSLAPPARTAKPDFSIVDIELAPPAP
jgi:hypothetical protein